MAGKIITLAFTEPQFEALVDLMDILEAMVGGGDGDGNEDFDKHVQKKIKMLDRMMNKNGWKRKKQ